MQDFWLPRGCADWFRPEQKYVIHTRLFKYLLKMLLFEFYESLLSGDDIDGDKDLQKDKDTQTQQRQIQIQVLPRPNVCYIYQKQGLQGFKILYWLSSCEDKDKDMISCIIRAEYFSGVKIFQRVTSFQEGIFSRVIFFKG